MHKINLSDSDNNEKTAFTASTENISNDSPYNSHPLVDEQASLGQNQTSLGSLDLKPKKSTDMTKKSKKLLMIISLFAIVAGTATGYGGYKLNAKSSGPTGKDAETHTQKVAGDNVKAGDVFGVQDPDTFKDSAEGYLTEGAADGEGSHQLLREGGASQTVVLTSSVTDLDKLVGMEVKVWGETFKAQKAGWLMDVGRVEVINPDGEEPLED